MLSPGHQISLYHTLLRIMKSRNRSLRVDTITMKIFENVVVETFEETLGGNEIEKISLISFGT